MTQLFGRNKKEDRDERERERGRRAESIDRKGKTEHVPTEEPEEAVESGTKGEGWEEERGWKKERKKGERKGTGEKMRARPEDMCGAGSGEGAGPVCTRQELSSTRSGNGPAEHNPSSRNKWMDGKNDG